MQEIRKLSLGFILLMFLCCALSGQTDYKQGYIITNDQDSVKGFVGDSFWKSSPDFVEFKELGSSKVQKFTAFDIQAFGFDNVAFESQKVSVNRIFSDDEKFKATPEIEYSQKRVFLENLVEGSKSLYQYKDKSGVKRYYIKEDDKFKLLLFQEYLQVDNSGKVEKVTIKKYIAQLYVYFSDCPNFQKPIKSTNYNKKSLFFLFKKYYKCSEVSNKPVEFRKSEFTKPVFSLIVGGSATKFKFIQRIANVTARVNTDFPRGFGLVVGASAEYYFSRKKHLSMGVNILYTRFDTKIEERFSGQSGDDLILSEIGYTSLRLQLLFRRYFDFASKKFFLSAGGSLGTLGYTKNERLLQRSFGGALAFESRSEFFRESSKYYAGSVFGFGTIFKNYSVELRHEFGGNLGKSGVFQKTRTSRFYLLIGYRL